MREIASSPEAIRSFLRAANDHQGLDSLRMELQALDRQISTLEGQIDRFLDLYLGGHWDKAELDRRKTNMADQLVRARRKREELRVRLAAADLDAGQVRMAVNYFALLANAERWMTRDQLHKLFAGVFPRVEIDLNGGLMVTTRVPLSGNESLMFALRVA